jgi:hypothetical protein
MKQKSLSDEELVAAYEEHKTLGKMAHALQVPHITIYRRSQKAKRLVFCWKIRGSFRAV